MAYSIVTPSVGKGGTVIRPVKARNVSHRVYEQLRDMIYRGELEPGSRMMSEREMAQIFNVGRPTVRSALQRLIDQGLVVSRRGVGTFVQDEGTALDKKPFLQALNGEEFTISDIQEVRMALEGKSAELAAKRASSQDLHRIRKFFEKMREERFAEKINIGTDIMFHMNIAYASKNIVHIHLMKSFYDVQTYAMSYSYTKALQGLNIGHKVDMEHERIVVAIENHNPVEARKAMEEHIANVLEVCLDLGM